MTLFPQPGIHLWTPTTDPLCGSGINEATKKAAVIAFYPIFSRVCNCPSKTCGFPLPVVQDWKAEHG